MEHAHFPATGKKKTESNLLALKISAQIEYISQLFCVSLGRATHMIKPSEHAPFPWNKVIMNIYDQKDNLLVEEDLSSILTRA